MMKSMVILRLILRLDVEGNPKGVEATAVAQQVESIIIDQDIFKVIKDVHFCTITDNTSYSNQNNDKRATYE